MLMVLGLMAGGNLFIAEANGILKNFNKMDYKPREQIKSDGLVLICINIPLKDLAYSLLL